MGDESTRVPPGQSSPASFGAQWSDPSFQTIDQHALQYESSRLTARYHHWVLEQCVRVARLEPGMSVLDFGCGRQHLRGHLPAGVQYTGYDIAAELSGLEDPRNGSYDCVFAIQVMMYWNQDGLREWVDSFRDLTPRVVVMVPSRNFLKDRVLDRLFGLAGERERLIRSEPAAVEAQLSRAFDRVERRRLAFAGEIGCWQRRG